jgi:hypothetical protein
MIGALGLRGGKYTVFTRAQLKPLFIFKHIEATYSELT